MTDRRKKTSSAVAQVIALISLAAIIGCDVATPAGSGPQRHDAAPQPDRGAKTSSLSDPADRPKPGPTAQYHVHQGVRVAFEMLPVRHAPDRPAGEFRDGDDVTFRFTLTDASSGIGLANTHPAAWLAARVADETRDALGAAKAIARFVRGERLFRPALDLNVFYVLTMNDDASITVVDPLFGFGNTRLLAMVPLKGNGEDWALSENQDRLYVSTLSSDRITVVDTSRWAEVASIAPVRRASRLALQPDGHYLWAAYGEPGSECGVAVIETERSKLVCSIPTGRGAHEIAFDRDGLHAFVANRDDGTVSLINTTALKKVVDIPTGKRPHSIAYSPASHMLYTTHEGDGTIAVLDPTSRSVIHRIQAEPGLGQIRFAPGGRLGFAVNPKANLVHIIDAATGRVVQTADTDLEPDGVSFAGRLAYVHHRATATVRVIPIDALGGEGKRVAVVDFPGGQNAPNARGAMPSLAATIVPASGENAVLVANPPDKTIYFYKEGMAAPMGSFSNYNRMPRAVLTVDRSLRERRPGVYETVGRLGAPGEYNLAFLLDNPRIAHYFDVVIKPDPVRAKQAKDAVVVEPIGNTPVLVAGIPTRLRFRIFNQATGLGIDGLDDVNVLGFSPPGWQHRYRAAPTGEGTYVFEITPSRPGAYYLYAESSTAGARLNEQWFLTLDVTKKENPR